MKIRNVLSVTLFLLSIPALAGRDGGGGSLVWNNGKLEPADLHYVMPAQTQIPKSYVKIDFKKYPKMLEALQYDMRFLKDRSRNDDLFSQWDFDNTEFYFVPKLSGKDLLPVEKGLIEKQVAFTREVIDPRGDQPIRAIVEVLKNLFDKLSPENQALVLEHELMHHKSYGAYGQHNFISPLIRDLAVLIPLRHRQEAGDRGLLSDGEFSASQNMANLMNKINGNDLVAAISRRGGGVFGEENGWKTINDDSNFVDLVSSLVGVSGTQVVKNNVVVNSHVSFIPGNACSSIEDNKFINSDVGIVCDRTRVANNSFIDTDIRNSVSLWGVTAFTGNNFKEVKLYEIAQAPNIPPQGLVEADNTFESVDEDESTGIVELSSSGNVLKSIHQKGNSAQYRFFRVSGDNNDIENVDLIGGTFNVSGQDQMNDIRITQGNLHVAKSAKVLQSTFPGDYGCDSYIGEGQVIVNQTLQCQIHRN